MTDNYYKIIGQRVKVLRKSKMPKMSGKKLAELSGLTYVTINNLENGKMPDVRLETFRRVAKALNVTMSAIVDETVSIKTQADSNEEKIGAIYDFVKQLERHPILNKKIITVRLSR